MSLNIIEIFRHGAANYCQEIVPWESAADLTENGRNVTKINAARLAQEYRGIKTTVSIFSSPIGRSLETSLIIRDELNKVGLKTEGEKGAPIIVRRCLQDQINFSNSVVELLARGGEWNGVAGQTIIDPLKTNPTGIDIGRYYVDDAVNIGVEVLESLPDDLKTIILSMETSERIQRRILKFINSLVKLNTRRDLTIVVTHDALIALLLKNCGSKVTRIDPSGRVTAEVVSGEFKVRKVV